MIMYNAAFHKSEKTKKLIENIKFKLLFLQLYSLDLNTLEKFLANLKKLVVKIKYWKNILLWLTLSMLL